jgi:hypothetical protein
MRMAHAIQSSQWQFCFEIRWTAIEKIATGKSRPTAVIRGQGPIFPIAAGRVAAFRADSRHSGETNRD